MKPKPSEMSSELRAAIDLRHQAEQRGHFEPLGRLLSLATPHGLITFGSKGGVGTGPDLAWILKPDVEYGELERDCKKLGHVEIGLLVLGQWSGIPPIRKNSHTPCSACSRPCEVCAQTGKKLCEDCGGSGWQSGGNWVSCPGQGCHKETGQYKEDCATCKLSEVRGQIRERSECPMCRGKKDKSGFSQMVCSACRGKKRRSTGLIHGSLDWQLPKCKTCSGTAWRGEWIKTDPEKYSADHVLPMAQSYPHVMLALGPIGAFDLRDFSTGRPRTFSVSRDAAGDLLHLLVPKFVRDSPRCKAYLVGGVVREQAEAGRVA
jgi:hypothetical protein